MQHAHPIAIIEKCIKRSVNWSSVTKFHLTTNMRVNCDEVEFSVLKLGNNEFTMKSDQPFEGCIAIPDRCVTNSVMTSVFGDVFDENTFADCVILCPTNDESLRLNEAILHCIPGDARIYFSSDDILTDDDEERAQYPIEFLNSLTPSGMPPHRLSLKVGAVVMLLRNLNLHEGLCNGTRLLVIHLHENCIDAAILTGTAVNSRVLIPRIQLAPSDSDMPFVLTRCQFHCAYLIL